MNHITKTAIAAMAFISVSACGNNASQNPTKDGVPQLSENNIEAVIAAMTLEEKATLLVGTGMDMGQNTDGPTVGATKNLVPGAAGTTHAIPRLGIPAIVLTDGPAGVRISPTREGTTETFYCTAFPIATLLASTWNTGLIEEVGSAMGNEVLEYGCDVLLGPGMNIHRSPLCGRNFEYYSEDPLLSGKMAAAMTRGIQSQGVGVSIKHYALNNQETNRMGNDVTVSERALREIYLKNFQIAVTEGHPWTIMSSYNKYLGTFTSECKKLLTDIPRGEWKFDGLVMTDWYGGKDSRAQVAAGNDLMMPGRPGQVEGIIEGINNGTLTMKELDMSVRRMLELIVRSSKFRGYQFSNKPDLKAHATVTRQSASEGMVLLKNDGTLPLATDIKKVVLFGNTSYRFIAGGTGSGDVNEAYTVSLGEGLANAGYLADKNVADKYEKYLASEKKKRDEAIAQSGNPLAAFLPQPPIPELLFTENEIKKAVAATDVVFLTIGRNSGEFFDRKVEGDFLLADAETQLIKNVVKVSHEACKKVVVVLNIGGVIETASWKDLPDAILLSWQGGQEGGNTVADILCGKVNPSGKLPMTFPITLADIPSSANFPTEAPPIDLSDFIGGKSGKTEDAVKDVDYTNYEEGIWVGYRGFEHFGKAVSYPFGYGLSYTSFALENMKAVQGKKGIWTITCEVTNTGSVAGKEVVELFVSAPGKDMEKPMRELKAFAKTSQLQPGQKETVTMTIDKQSLASYDETRMDWVVEKGEYTLQAGNLDCTIKL